MKHRYIINIAGTDYGENLSWNKEVKASSFTMAFVMALEYIDKLQKLSAKDLRITSITELPS